jgi:hypothetical protein
MLELSPRPHERILFPSLRTAVHVLSIRPGEVRLGIEAAPADQPACPGTALHLLDQLVHKRLEIARDGLDEVRRRARSGRAEDVELLLDKLDEDLHLLQRRVRREVGEASEPDGGRDTSAAPRFPR